MSKYSCMFLDLAAILMGFLNFAEHALTISFHNEYLIETADIGCLLGQSGLFLFKFFLIFVCSARYIFELKGPLASLLEQLHLLKFPLQSTGDPANCAAILHGLLIG